MIDLPSRRPDSSFELTRSARFTGGCCLATEEDLRNLGVVLGKRN